VRLVLHIGTPKSGTTSLQEFLQRNRETLATLGVYYAAPKRTVTANAIGNALNRGDNARVRAFFETHARRAGKAGAHTVVVSAERLYGLWHRGQRDEEAFEHQRMRVCALQELLPAAFEKTEITCYFRRPDRFLESFYNQKVKSQTYSEDFQEFVVSMKPAVLYARNMQLWADVFGKENCLPRVYDAVVSDFCETALGLNAAKSAFEAGSRSNERLSRDVLEFKRGRNRELAHGQKFLECEIARELERSVNWLADEPASYQDFFSPAERAAYLARLEPELIALASAYELPPFPEFDRAAAEACWQPYPGLSAGRRDELEKVYERISRRLGYRVERLAIRSDVRLAKAVVGLARRAERVEVA
jgi:hypothetical protein